MYKRQEIERVGGFAFVRVAGHDRVYVSTSYRADMSRDTLYTATADVPGFRQGWRDQEQAVIELRSLFIPGEGMRYLLDLLSRMSKDSGVTTRDNGVTQTVEAKTGVSLRQNVEINPRVKLQPFRTFLEVEQPQTRARAAPTGSTWTVRKARPCTVPASRRPAMPAPAV